MVSNNHANNQGQYRGVVGLGGIEGEDEKSWKVRGKLLVS
jgi:hypothetical protein